MGYDYTRRLDLIRADVFAAAASVESVHDYCCTLASMLKSLPSTTVDFILVEMFGGVLGMENVRRSV